jgi:hypothetical protein
MQHIGIYGAARGLGSTLLAAHLYYYLREHGVHCSASSRGFRGARPLGLTRWADIKATAREPQCFQALPRIPLGFGVHVDDMHAELFARELGENPCTSWVIPIRDEATLERGLQIASHLEGRVILVWNGADWEKMAMASGDPKPTWPLPTVTPKFATWSIGGGRRNGEVHRLGKIGDGRRPAPRTSASGGTPASTSPAPPTAR